MCNLIGFVNNGELFNTFFFINGFQILILVSISKVMGKLNISLGLCTGMLYRVFKTFFFFNLNSCHWRLDLIWGVCSQSNNFVHHSPGNWVDMQNECVS